MESKLVSMSETAEIEPKKRLVTAALPYINNVPHLGHIVGSHLPADIFARFCRAKGYDTLFIGGTDDNGSASEITASQLGVDIGEFQNRLNREHTRIYDWFGISYDNFSRTTRPIHHETVGDFFEGLRKKGFISEDSMPVFYSDDEKQFLPDRYVVGECPKCGYEDANADQCESCTTILDSAELKHPRSKLTGSKVELKKTPHLFFKLDKVESRLRKWINKQTRWRKQVKNLALGWMQEGLRQRSISRDLKHGVPIPLKGYDDKVFYVWFEAPIGYVSSTKEATDDWESYWAGDDTQIFNFLGKDNIPFHTIFWPGMVMAHGKFNLPENVVGLQYLNYEGKKFSKSKGVGVFCERLPELDLPADVWRAYLAQVIPETSDTEFKWGEFQEKVNSDLIGNYGNFANRIISFSKKRLEGRLKKPTVSRLTERDRQLLASINHHVKKIGGYLENAQIRKAYAQMLTLSTEGNRYLHDEAPWSSIKEDPKRAQDVLYNGAELLRKLAVVSAPFLPETSQRLWAQLGLKGSPLDSGSWDQLDSSHKTYKIGDPEILFQRMEDEDVAEYRKTTSQGTDLKGFFK